MTQLPSIAGVLTTLLAVAIAARPGRQPTRCLPDPGGHSRRARVPHIGRVASIGTLVVVGIAISPATLAPASTLVAAVCTMRKWRVVQSRRSRDRRVAQLFPDAVDLFVVAVRAGFLPAQAMRQIAPMGPAELRAPLADVCGRLDAGETFSDALATLRLTVGAAAHPFIDALAAADRYGLPLSPVLDRLVTDTREQRRRDGEASARELPVRLAAPLVVCTLPSFALLAIAPLLLGALASLHL